ncbi:MAG: hypothetical protein ACRDB1_15670 [Microcoleaceae cyanobacterium]
MTIHLNRLQKQRLIFLIGVILLYSIVFVWREYLFSTIWWDEYSFWRTSLKFSKTLIPSLELLTNYKELNTPLPFIIFGASEHLFKGDIWAGRLLNFFLSLIIICIIGLPNRYIGAKRILSAVGLILCPYYLWVSTLLYTDIISSFFGVLGFWFYLRNYQWSSAIAFILAIASRQYMLAFPLAIACFESFAALRDGRPIPKKVLAPAIAALSIIGWFILFKGLAPKVALEKLAPPVQLSLWAIAPNNFIHFLAAIGTYFVIPEILLFHYRDWLDLPNLARKIKTFVFEKKNILIALGLLLFVFIFPPTLVANGALIKIAKSLPNYHLKMALFYVFALITCWRFNRISIASWILLFYGVIMMKAFPWDRYALPVIIIFWYLKSMNALDWEKPQDWRTNID